MIVFVVVLCIIIVATTKRNRNSDENFLDKKSTTTINGIFAILIFLSHSSQYLSLPDNVLDECYLAFQKFHNQWVVTTYLTFSGFGVMLKLQSDKGYVKTFPRNRLLKTLVNFDIAVLIFLIMDLLLNIQYSGLKIAGSFIGLTSIGNSNWYIFTILLMYTFTYIAAIVLKNRWNSIAALVMVMTLIYVCIVYIIGLPSRFGSTSICYPLGMWIAIYKEQLYKRIKGVSVQSVAILLFSTLVCVVTYNYRGNIFIKNISSIFFVLIIIWLMTHFKVENRALNFCGKLAFSIYILQRLPMNIISHFFTPEGISNYVFVAICLLTVIVIAFFFDKILSPIDRKIERKTSDHKIF